MQKFQTDPTLYYVDKQTKCQIFQAKVHNVYPHNLCFTYDSFSSPEPPVPLADEAWNREPDPRAQASPTKRTGDSGDENAYDEATMA